MEKNLLIQPKVTLDIIRSAMKEQKVTQEDLASVVGKERSVVSRILSGKVILGITDLIKIGNHLSLDVGKLIVGIRSEGPSEFEHYNDIDWKNLSDEQIYEIGTEIQGYPVEHLGPASGASNENRSFFADGHSRNIGPKSIAEIDVTVGAGEGAVGETVVFGVGDDTYSAHPVVAEWMIPEGFANHSLGINVNRSLVMKVMGDSMHPTYLPGDRVIVDLRQTEMTVDGVYIISDGESPPQIKRLQRVLFSSPAEVDIVSDNQAHISQRVELGRLIIHGRVAGRVTPT